MQLLLYSGAIIVILYLMIMGIMRVKMPFWRTQPVFHIYNLKYWLNPPGFIDKEPPGVNKYLNLINTMMIPVADAAVADASNDVKIKQICNFIRDYYVLHHDAEYKPTKEDIIAYLTCNNHPSFFMVYQEPRLLLEQGNELSSPTLDQEITGVVSIRALNVSLYKKKNNTHKNKPTTFAAYYVDNLCVKPECRKKGIPPQLIQTLYYNIARINTKVNAYMFKREGTLNAIVPLVYFDTHGFDISKFNTNVILNPSMTLIAIGTQQLNVFISFLKLQKRNFKCSVLPDVSSILNLIKLEKLLIYGILSGGEIIAIYVFRPLELYYTGGTPGPPTINDGGAATSAKGGKTVECIAIVNGIKNKEDKSILIAGFNMSLLKVQAKCNASMLLLEETAHSSPVVNALVHNYTVLRKFKSPTAFFLYNYASYSIDKGQVLLIY